MILPYFENGLNLNASPLPDEMYRNLEQAFISEQYDNTSSRYQIQEQEEVGSNIYNPTEAWLAPVVGTTSTGLKTGEDFKKLIFENIEHPVVRGLYYYFDNNYWITYFTDDFAGLPRGVAVRRCNNWLRMVDPDNGSIFSVPCVVDYDMSSPSQQVSSYIITPNNHAVVKVQGNDDTLRLFKYNTRFMLAGRPFKLLAYQNTLMNEVSATNTTYLELDLYLDELHAQDDIENQLAFNGVYNYKVVVDDDTLNLLPNSTGQLKAKVYLNGEIVDKEVEWKSSSTTMTIDKNGAYKLSDKIGDKAVFTAQIPNNDKVYATVEVTIVEQEQIEPNIVFSPIIDKIRHTQTIDFNIDVYNNNELILPENIIVSLSDTDELLHNDYIIIKKKNQGYFMKCIAISEMPIIIYVHVINKEPVFNITKQFIINTVSMMG